MNRCMITGAPCEGGEAITLPGNPGAIWVSSSTKALLLLGHSVTEILSMQSAFNDKVKDKEARLALFEQAKMKIE